MIDFFPKFFDVFQWQSSISIFVQIWQYSRYESRNFLAPFHIVGNCDGFWKFVMKFFLAKRIPKNKELATKCFFTKWKNFGTKKIIGSHILIS
jgi:hypothetical protein